MRNVRTFFIHKARGVTHTELDVEVQESADTYGTMGLFALIDGSHQKGGKRERVSLWVA